MSLINFVDFQIGFYYFLMLQKRSFFETKSDTLFDLIEVSKLQLLTQFTKCVFTNIYLKLIQIQVTYAILLTKIY